MNHLTMCSSASELAYKGHCQPASNPQIAPSLSSSPQLQVRFPSVSSLASASARTTKLGFLPTAPILPLQYRRSVKHQLALPVCRTLQWLFVIVSLDWVRGLFEIASEKVRLSIAGAVLSS